MRPLHFPTTALLAAFLLLAPAAYAEPERGGDDVSKKIQEQMQKIIDLMRKNEQALLDLSTGREGRPERVDVTPPDLPREPGANDGNRAGSRPDPKSGADANKALEDLIRSQRATSGQIPDELEELVRMVPL